jgi:hypothetical protein
MQAHRGLCRYRGVQPHAAVQGLWEAWLPCPGGGSCTDSSGVVRSRGHAGQTVPIHVSVGARAACHALLTPARTHVTVTAAASGRVFH